jgi:S1-C subfamily serine protease
MLSHARLRVAVLSTAIIACMSAFAFAQTTSPPCAAPELIGDLGFTGTHCSRCVITGQHVPGRADIEFGTEPAVSGIKRGGPADGKLEENDVLVAIDGLLITSQAGALQYSWLTPGKPVRVTVRRAGELKDVEIVPTPKCKTITPLMGRSRLARGTRLTQVVPTSSSPSSPSASPPRGWFGIGVSCTSCGLTRSGAVRPGSNAIPFGAYLDVTAVASDSPAEKGGLRPGDLLVAIDGLSMKSVEGAAAFRAVKPNQTVLFLVVRNAEVLKISVTAGPPR